MLISPVYSSGIEEDDADISPPGISGAEENDADGSLPGLSGAEEDDADDALAGTSGTRARQMSRIEELHSLFGTDPDGHLRQSSVPDHSLAEQSLLQVSWADGAFECT